MFRSYFHAIVAASATALCVHAAPVLADSAPPVVTDHQIVVGGKRISYRAFWSRIMLKDRSGQPDATISATSYLRSDVADARRPVIFLFNGGPGASSSPLHFGAFGPRRLQSNGASGQRVLVDNAESLLDIADLVFIDPVGTGFSEELRENGGKPYWSASGDAASVLSFIRDWLKNNNRSRSPLFVAGESYGGYRAAMMAASMGDLNLSGLILISPAIDAIGSSSLASIDQDHVNTLPTMAAVAWVNGKVRHDRRSVERVWEDARAFAQSDYATALQQGSALPPAERDRIAARVAAMIGLPTAAVKKADLRVDTQEFLETLIPGSIVGRLDGRVVAVKPPVAVNADRPAAANDPALGLGRSNVIKSPAIRNYLRDELRTPVDRDYYSLTLDVNFKWNWNDDGRRPEERQPVAENIARLMKKRPDMRLLVFGGYFDFAVPLLSPRYVLAHADIPRERMTSVAFVAGHSPFDTDQNRAVGAADIRAFILRGRADPD